MDVWKDCRKRTSCHCFKTIGYLNYRYDSVLIDHGMGKTFMNKMFLVQWGEISVYKPTIWVKEKVIWH